MNRHTFLKTSEKDGKISFMNVDSPMGLNKRLLDVGFRKGGCEWFINGVFGFPTDYDIAINARFEIYPHGHHPSTIGVATAWLRSFEKIGDTLCFWKQQGFPKLWIATINGEHPIKGCDSELEALVEFAEWAKKEGLME